METKTREANKQKTKELMRAIIALKAISMHKQRRNVPYCRNTTHTSRTRLSVSVCVSLFLFICFCVFMFIFCVFKCEFLCLFRFSCVCLYVCVCVFLYVFGYSLLVSIFICVHHRVFLVLVSRFFLLSFHLMCFRFFL